LLQREICRAGSCPEFGALTAKVQRDRALPLHRVDQDAGIVASHTARQQRQLEHDRLGVGCPGQGPVVLIAAPAVAVGRGVPLVHSAGQHMICAVEQLCTHLVALDIGLASGKRNDADRGEVGCVGGVSGSIRQHSSDWERRRRQSFGCRAQHRQSGVVPMISIEARVFGDILFVAAPDAALERLPRHCCQGGCGSSIHACAAAVEGEPIDRGGIPAVADGGCIETETVGQHLDGDGCAAVGQVQIHAVEIAAKRAEGHFLDAGLAHGDPVAILQRGLVGGHDHSLGGDLRRSDGRGGGCSQRGGVGDDCAQVTRDLDDARLCVNRADRHHDELLALIDACAQNEGRRGGQLRGFVWPHVWHRRPVQYRRQLRRGGCKLAGEHSGLQCFDDDGWGAASGNGKRNGVNRQIVAVDARQRKQRAKGGNTDRRRCNRRRPGERHAIRRCCHRHAGRGFGLRLRRLWQMRKEQNGQQEKQRCFFQCVMDAEHDDLSR
jgi:hypothetical protein